MFCVTEATSPKDIDFGLFNGRTGVYTKVGQTEVITDNLNPVFVKSVLVNYYFEERQDLRVSVFDVDNFDPKAPVEQNLMGTVEFRMDQLLYAPNGTLTLPIKGFVSFFFLLQFSKK